MTGRPSSTSRRTLLASLVAPVMSTPALSPDDPHIAWWAEAERLNLLIDEARAREDEEADSQLSAQFAKLYRLCIDTPARTAAGMAVVLKTICVNEGECTQLDEDDYTALLWVADALDRMAGRV